MIETGMHPGEHIILTVRKHPLLLVGQLLPFIILDYIPYFLPELGKFLEAAAQAPTADWSYLLSFDNPVVAFMVGIYWLFVWMGAFGVFVNHYLDQWIVTNERIIDINQRGFWSRDVSSLLLVRVQDVETEVHGFFNTLFGFGTLSVETGGAEVGRFRMTGLPNPKHIRDRILAEAAKLHNEYTAKHPV
jgi:membrane protein YdbS with pleckstrin-like domain